MTVEVSGLPLPAALVTAIEAGDWQAPTDEAVYREVFRDDPVTPEFYDVAGMQRQNRAWQTVSPEDFLCSPSAGNLGLSLELSVVIAGLGPDMPVVLDYRLSRDEPRVLYLGGDDPLGWFEVAPDIERLIEKLRLRG